MLSIQAISGIFLVAVAVIGGGFATLANIRGARGPRERLFVIRICVAAWLLIASMLALMYFLPSPWRYAAMFFYFFGLPWLIYRWSKQHQLIRMLDEREKGEANTT